MLTFMNLPFEKTDQVIQIAYWYPTHRRTDQAARLADPECLTLSIAGYWTYGDQRLGLRLPVPGKGSRMTLSRSFLLLQLQQTGLRNTFQLVLVPLTSSCPVGSPDQGPRPSAAPQRWPH